MTTDTAETKAKELVDKFSKTRMNILTRMDSIPTVICDYPIEQTAKECALIAVDEILDVLGGEGVYSFADDKVTQLYNKVRESITKM